MLEKVRKGMVHQQPGAATNQVKGSQMHPHPPVAPGGAAKPSAPASAAAVPNPVPQHAKHVSSKPPPSSLGAAGGMAGKGRFDSTSSKTLSSSGPSDAAAGLGMSWNPVRLMSPFEKPETASSGDSSAQHNAVSKNLPYTASTHDQYMP